MNDKDYAVSPDSGDHEEIEVLGDAAEGFRVGWAQVMRGETLSEEEFWEAVKVNCEQ